jgi:DNA polymerase-1
MVHWGMAIYLIDGNSYVYRAFHAIPATLTNADGMPTNAIYGFTTMLLKVLRDRKPEGVIVSFDTPHPTGRHLLFEGYKAHRPETPPDLIAQLPHVKRVIAALGIRDIEVPGYEADDVIGTLAERARELGREVMIVTSDKDMLQLVAEGVLVYDASRDRVLDEAYVRERLGVGPERVVEYMALVGDTADNIPGIKGIGEKTARELMVEFASLEEMVAHPERIARERTRRLVTEGLDSMRMSRTLATIDRAVPLEVSARDFAPPVPDYRALADLFREFRFTSLLRLVPVPESAAGGDEGAVEVVTSPARLAAILKGPPPEVALDTETTGLDPHSASLVGISLATGPDVAYYVPLGHSGGGEQMAVGEAIAVLGPVLADPAVAVIGHNLKYDLLVLRGAGAEIAGPLCDTMVAAYLLSPERVEHGLATVGLQYLGKGKREFKEVLGARESFGEVGVEEAAAYAGRDAALALELWKALAPRLRAEGLDALAREVEMPLVRVLADIEAAGMRIDTARLASLGRELEGELASLESRIHFLAGEEFNINSPRQLAHILFDVLGLTPGKKKKTGYSTDVGVLEELAPVHPLPGEVLAYRTLAKLKNTYVDVLPGLVDPRTGRLHTSLNQTVAATGRLSSSEPNLQNIPVRGDWGRRIREAFVAPPGSLIVSADYSQIELRILAHLSGDAALVRAFAEGGDIHASTAAEIFGVAPGRVTPEMRRTAKTVNFGVIYGMSAFGLSKALGIGRKEAAEYIERYFKLYAGVDAYVRRVVAEATASGEVRTLMGRRRRIPELASGNPSVRSLGERLAVNTTVQGTAADIIKVAMIRLHDRLLREHPAARIILQVHDELLVETPEDECEAVMEALLHEMRTALPLDVPIAVEAGAGPTWADAHK